jgi:hypothetical protein
MNELKQPPENWASRDLIAIAFAMVFPTIVTFVYFQWLKDSDSSFQQIAFAIGKSLQFVFPVAWIWLWHRSKLTRVASNVPTAGSTDAERSRQPATTRHAVLIGIGFGLVVVAGMFAIYFLWIAPSEHGPKMVELIKEKITGMKINSFWKYVALSIFYALCHSFLEEYYWRWFVFDMLQKFVSTPVAIVISSLGFMAHHVIVLGFYFNWQWMTYPISFCIAVGGMFWAWQFHQTGKLRPSWISHLIVDAGIFALGYLLIREIL